MARLAVGGLELALTRAGPTAGTPLVLLHGFLGTGAEMLAAAELLEPARPLVALDLPGHGGSAPPPRDATFASVLDGLHAALDRLELPLFDLWGYSLGGRLALALAARPEIQIRIRRLILESASPGLTDLRERDARAAEDDARAAAIRDDLAGFLAQWEAQPMFAGEAPRRSQPQDAEGLARAVAVLSPGRQPLLELSRITRPTAWITGARDLKYVELAKAAAVRMPAARHITIADAGHAPHRAQPRATAAAISAFLQEPA